MSYRISALKKAQKGRSTGKNSVAPASAGFLIGVFTYEFRLQINLDRAMTTADDDISCINRINLYGNLAPARNMGAVQ